MFERYTEKARRVIFFALRSQPVRQLRHRHRTSPSLGLLREDGALMRYVGPFPFQSPTEIRTEIEKVIQRGAPIATSVEVPLSADSKKILNLAGEEADRLGHRHIGTEHVLLAIFRRQDCLAATLLTARGAKADAIRQQIV